MGICLFCKGNGPFNKREHIIPEGLGNDELILENEVCDICNQYFGSKIENYVLNSTPIAFWRGRLGIRGKCNQKPSAEFTNPKEKGRWPRSHYMNDSYRLESHDDFSVSIDLEDKHIRHALYDGGFDLRTVITPYMLFKIGRFLCKVGVELLCLDNPKRARNSDFDQARNYARYGNCFLWPIFHTYENEPTLINSKGCDNGDILEDVFCYDYQLVACLEKYILMGLTVGQDTWVICLNNPFPHPEILQCLSKEPDLFWYNISPS